MVHAAKRLLADAIAVIAGGARAPGIRELHARLARWESRGSATALIGKRRLSPPSAALANGAAAHALDYDDIHDASRVHSMCVVLPAVLATAEDAGQVDGREFLLALAIGAEMHARFGLAYERSLAHGWHPTTLFGAPAAALAAGRLLRLDAAKLHDALGIALHQAGGSVQSAYDGALSKRLGPGFAARDAVTSVFLARDGLNGPRDPLDGKAGFFALHARGEADPSFLLEELGTRWRIAEYSFKPYPACRCSHAAIGQAVALNSQGIRAEDVEAVEIAMSEANWKLVGKPYDASLDSVVHAQFSAAYSFSRALIDGRVGPAAYERPAITDERISAFSRKVSVEVDPQIPSNAMEPVRVRVALRGGRVIERQGSTLKGAPEDPMTDADVRDKLRGCLEFGGYDPRDAQAILEAVCAIERRPDAAAALVSVFP